MDWDEVEEKISTCETLLLSAVEEIKGLPFGAYTSSCIEVSIDELKRYKKEIEEILKNETV